jgi:hypothetical protein
MGWFSKRTTTVASSPKHFKATSEALLHSITGLRTGLSIRVHQLYSPQYGDEARFLCAGILNYVTASTPTNEAGKRYMSEKPALVKTEAAKLHLAPEIRKALSYLYTAEILYLTMAGLSGNKLAQAQIPRLTERASELNIVIPDAQEISGKGDAYSCAQAIAAYAIEFTAGR